MKPSRNNKKIKKLKEELVNTEIRLKQAQQEMEEQKFSMESIRNYNHKVSERSKYNKPQQFMETYTVPESLFL
jgi:hypothetical protein